MTDGKTTQLAACIACYQASIPGLAEVGKQLASLISTSPRPLWERDRERGESSTESPSPQPSPIKGEGAGYLDALIDFYEQCYPLLEQTMWADESNFAPLLEHYQALFREQEALIAQQGKDSRHHFILSIPVADRPPHLRACLESIYQACTLFNYGGNTSGVWDKIQIIVAEDSREERNIQRHIQIFRNTNTLMLTGKMVGEPPVSPSVMAANFLDDIIAFFTRLATLRATQTCQFHHRPEQPAGDAAYHDMAKLFRFKNGPTSYPYQCRLTGAHDHSACFKDFAQRLNSFFFGKHLTRKTWFEYKGHFTQLSPARTIYPGNYIVNYAGLKYIIPFGHLRLRMSGPTAGRLIAAEIADRFASFNMPNLHRRTTEAGLIDDFRPGVEVGAHAIDLTNEFERQFFGDLMLFSTEALLKLADVNQPFAKDLLVKVIEQKETELLALYQQKHDAIDDKQRQLHELVFNADHWWQYSTAMSNSLQAVRAFIHNIERNFGEQAEAWRQIRSDEHRAARKQQIIEALIHYREERDAWDGLF